ncbi:hypothetical protein [Chelativorans sp. AA-79]|uniref:hypothetical protein n=1 Tax=Chelativorans sp. AA-79 TaxID=3028735 RepID=UPI0023F8E89B|nr:hypothetical protein [Chelativorans sp. AA-79]WEX08234.1 hypothetical protein PVE73_19445 [Chelativorans sp. AA-79]
MLERKDHSVLVVRVSHIAMGSAENRSFLPRDIHLLGTASTLGEIGTVIPEEKLLPLDYAEPAAGPPRLQHAYLVGRRVFETGRYRPLYGGSNG